MRGLFFLTTIMVVLQAYGQTDDTRIAATKTPLAAVEQIVFSALDNEALRAHELQRRTVELGVAPRFAEAISVNINPDTHGHWELLPDGRALWRLRLHSPGAYSLNLGFRDYFMPPGGLLLLYDPSQRQMLGPFTPTDNAAHQELWTPVLPGDELVLEVQLPADQRSALRLQLKSVNHDFMNFFASASGACNLDVVCGSANGWGIVEAYRDVIQSVAVYGLGGTQFCTGFLLNNTQNDCTPYFATANHCGVTENNAASLVVYWNYQNSVCRQPGTPISGGIGDGRLTDFNSGAVLRANYALTDITLLELDDPVSPTANAFFAGWSLDTEVPTDTLALVHHPGTDEKRISFRFDGSFAGTRGGGGRPVPDGDYLIIPNWNIGTSEGGSSGAPLFDKNRRVVGQLFGGTASCLFNGYDIFGWFQRSWAGGQLQPWLHPAQTAIPHWDGKWQSTCNLNLEVNKPFEDVCAATAAVFAIAVSEEFTDLVELTLEGLPAGVSPVFSQNPVIPGRNTTLTIATANLPVGEYALRLRGTDGMAAADIALGLRVAGSAAPSVTLQTPADGARNTSLFPIFTWATDAAVAEFDVQIATDNGFSQLIATMDALSAMQLSNIRLNALTTYYWRVRARNACGVGEWSEIQNFTTADVTCVSATPSDVPQTIVGFEPNMVFSEANITLPGVVVDVRINNLDITHSWVGDLAASLRPPSGQRLLRLFDRPGVPEDIFGCDGANLQLSFRDDAPNTAIQLENTCGNNPAIEGAYQPLDPFASLAGESAEGLWTLFVEDFEEGDGGRLNAWTLEVCAVLPRDVFIRTAADSLAICANEELSFEVFVGTDFDAAGVQLQSVGLPPDAVAIFSKNPAAPGDTVRLVISNLDVGDTYDLTILATDGMDTANTEVRLLVLDSPRDYALLFPDDGAQNIPLSTSFEWESAPGAERYVIFIESADGGWAVSDTLPGPFYFVSNLESGTVYNWRVQAINACGVGESAVAQFTTIPDVSVTATPVQVNACPTDRPAFNIFIGPGYAAPASIMYEVTPAADIAVSFNADTLDVPAGTTIRATLGNLSTTPPGEYTIRFRVSDGIYTNEDEVTLRLRGVPGVPALLEPADGAITMMTEPVLRWRADPDARSYRVELARDDRFTMMVQVLEIGDTTYTPTEPLGAGEYHWRITALNECGFSTSGVFDFLLQTSSIHYWQGQRVTFRPNPTNGLLQIDFSQPLSGQVQVAVFSLQGQLLQSGQHEQATTSLSLDLSHYAIGTYILRVVHGSAVLTQRVILQK
ncbi:MAG TPA: T9SS type A sorting domain-containing protein [Saprospiraceae bacterium]|nr:T9SS type A sorting domain-containing protein [Saprospiraceae bacterium]HMP26200.1 T9SS type A sorting domain-containing protein [Saprospiraceae bacterium]